MTKDRDGSPCHCEARAEPEHFLSPQLVGLSAHCAANASERRQPGTPGIGAPGLGVRGSGAPWTDTVCPRTLSGPGRTITAFIDQHNADPKPLRWQKSADDILAAIAQ